METINFTKMHGLGNDFIILDGRKEKLSEVDLKKLAIDICDRHFGLGADGLLIAWPSEKADLRLQIFNPDGSEPKMCGNGIRCFAKYIYESTEEKKEVFSVETLAAVIVPALIIENGQVIGAEVDMGIPKDEGEVALYGYPFRKINLGNPHAVTLVEDFNFPWIEIGQKVEIDSHFPQGTNVEFVKVLNEKEIEVKVWERGAGETLACGTGACAAVVTTTLLGKTQREVLVRLPGGNLDIEWSEDNHLCLRGPAEKICEGKYYL